MTIMPVSRESLINSFIQMMYLKIICGYNEVEPEEKKSSPVLLTLSNVPIIAAQ